MVLLCQFNTLTCENDASHQDWTFWQYIDSKEPFSLLGSEHFKLEQMILTVMYKS